MKRLLRSTAFRILLVCLIFTIYSRDVEAASGGIDVTNNGQANPDPTTASDGGIDSKPLVPKADKDQVAAPATAADRFLTITPEVKTIFPLFLGAGIDMSLWQHLQIGIAFGVTPKLYYQTIGSTAANLAGNAAYKDVLEAAFQNNSVARLSTQYNFRNPHGGWHLGLAFAQLSSSGAASIDKVLSAAGSPGDYTQLKNLLALAGRSTDIDMTTKIQFAELFVGYAWSFAGHWKSSIALGAAKVLSNQVQLKTGLPNFEASTAGQSLLRKSEGDISSVITQYGFSPTAALSVGYSF